MEQAVVLTNQEHALSLVAVVRFERGPGLEALREAIGHVQRREPLLRASIHPDGRRHRFHLLAHAPPVPIEVDASAEGLDWLSLAAAQLNVRVGESDPPLLRLHALLDADDMVRDLVIHAHHAIADAAGLAALIACILERCAAPRDGLAVADGGASGCASPAPDIGELPPSADSLLPARNRGLRGALRLAAFAARQLAGEIRYRRAARGTRTPPLRPASRVLATTRSLSEERTNALVARGRAHRLSVHSMIGAALLLTVYRRLYAPAITPLRTVLFADLRPSLRSRLTPQALGCYMSLSRHQVTVRPGDALLDVATRLQAETSAAFRRGDKALSLLAAERLMRFVLGHGRERMASTAVSYAGPHGLPRAIGPYRLRGLHGFISSNRLGPELSASAHLDFGRLVLDFMTMEGDFSQNETERLADDVVALLEAGATPSTAGGGNETPQAGAPARGVGDTPGMAP